MKKHPISSEFFPFSILTPPIRSPKMAGWLGSLMRPPRWLRRDSEVSVHREVLTSYDGAEIEVLVFDPYRLEGSAPCLLYYHGGGFFFGGSGHHYRMAKTYALEAGCRVVFVQYRLAPKHPHPTPSEDCYAALQWTFANADRLNILPEKVAVGGDSAGGALAAAVCQMARDRGTPLPCLQLLLYPVTDRRMETESQMRYTDTPVWNSKLSVKMWQGYLPDPEAPQLAYASPMEASSFARLPAAYLETAEFDCLHDEGIAYGKALQSAGVPVFFHETKGTMHGFDIMENAPTTRQALSARIQYLREHFYPPTKLT